MAWRRALADGLGTALLLAVVVGSGIMGERLAQGNDAIALLANSLATGFGLFALILAFSMRSGAHFNPVVTATLAVRGQFPGREVAPYMLAQFVGAILGVLLAHAMFDLPLYQASAKARHLGLGFVEGTDDKAKRYARTRFKTCEIAHEHRHGAANFHGGAQTCE